MSDDYKPKTRLVKMQPKFEPSKELTAARELLDISRNSGHPRPMIDYAGLETFFQVLENEERKVFEQQLTIGGLALQNANMRELLAEIVELGSVDTIDRSEETQAVSCVWCTASTIYGEIKHDDFCPITKAKEITG